MKKAIIVILLVLAAAAIVFFSMEKPLPEGQCELKPKAIKRGKDIIVYLASTYLQPTYEKPLELKDLPPSKPEKINYYSVRLGDRNVPAAVCYSGSIMLYFDTNGDGNLSNEKGFRAKAVRTSWFITSNDYRFGPVHVEFGNNDKEIKIDFYIDMSRGERLVLYPANYLEGKIKVGQRSYKVAMLNSSFTGQYNKMFSPPDKNFTKLGCDMFGIDLNNNDKFEFESFIESSEFVPLGTMVKIKNTYYSINISKDKKFLELKKTEPEFGCLDLGKADLSIQLWSDAAYQFLQGSKEKWHLPAGKYFAASIKLNQSDDAGNKWTFTSLRKSGKLGDFEILPGQETSFKIGPPFLIKTNIEHGAKNNVFINFYLEGQSGEQYWARVLKNGNELAAPGFKVLDEGGNVLVSDKFKYG